MNKTESTINIIENLKLDDWLNSIKKENLNINERIDLCITLIHFIPLSKKYYQLIDELLIPVYKELDTLPIGLLFGICKLAFLTQSLIKYDKKYTDKLQIINNILKKKSIILIKYIKTNSNTNISNSFYDFTWGLAGIVSYMATNLTFFKEILFEVHSIFMEKVFSTNLKNKTGFYIKDKNGFNEGCYDFGMAHGLTGILKAFIILHNLNIKKSDSKKCIKKILDLLIISFDKDKLLPNSFYDCQNNIFITPQDPIISYSWCYGLIGILPTLKSTKKIIKSNYLDYLYLKILNNLKRNIKKIEFSDYTFCHGLSGLYFYLNENSEEFLDLEVAKKIEKALMDNLQYNLKLPISLTFGYTSIILPLLIKKINIENTVFQQIFQ